MQIERHFKLRELAARSGVPEFTLRQEVLSGRLRAIAASPGRSAPLLVSESSWAAWVAHHARARVAARVRLDSMEPGAAPTGSPLGSDA